MIQSINICDKSFNKSSTNNTSSTKNIQLIERSKKQGYIKK